MSSKPLNPLLASLFLKDKPMKPTDEAVVYSGYDEITIKGRIKVENQFLLA
jgi:hypothetical protein